MVDNVRIENINELQIWLDGQFKLVAQSQTTTNEEVNKLRDRVHDIANHVGKLNALNIEQRFKDFGKILENHDGEIEKVNKDAFARKAVLAATGIAGGAIGAVSTILLELYKAFS